MSFSFIFKNFIFLLRTLSFSSIFLGLTYILRFILTFSLVKILSPTEFGYFSWVMTAFLFLSTLNLNGLDNFSLRKVAELKSSNPEDIGNFQKFAQKKVFFNSFFIFIFLFLIFFISINTDYFGQMSYQFLVLATFGLALPFSSFVMINSSNLRVINSPRLAQIGDSFLQPLFLILFLLIIFLLIEIQLNAFKVILLTISSWILSFFFSFYFYRKLAFRSPNNLIKKEKLLEWKFSANAIMIGVFGWSILSKSDVLILGFFVEASELSSYFVSLRIAELMLFFPSVATYVWSGRIANLYYENKIDEAQKLIKFISRLCFSVSIFLFSIGFLFSSEILYLFNESFSKNVTVFRLALFSYLIISSVGILGHLLLIIGEESFLAKIQWVLGIIFSICISISALNFGLIGSVITFGIFQIIVNILMISRLRVKTGLSSHPF